MGKIEILNYTTKEPLEMIGHMSGVCYGSKVDDAEKNVKRGRENLASGHGRVAEFPDVYMIIDGYSARVLRELYTHIGGAPTRLQASTRYIDYTSDNMKYITPPSIESNERYNEWYETTMKSIQEAGYILKAKGASKEDIANILPLGMKSKMVYKINFRTLIDMSHQRMCNRAYWEFRNLFNDIRQALSEYSEQWAELVQTYFKPKCYLYGYCTETYGCGLMPKKKDIYDVLFELSCSTNLTDEQKTIIDKHLIGLSD